MGTNDSTLPRRMDDEQSQALVLLRDQIEAGGDPAALSLLALVDRGMFQVVRQETEGLAEKQVEAVRQFVSEWPKGWLVSPDWRTRIMKYVAGGISPAHVVQFIMTAHQQVDHTDDPDEIREWRYFSACCRNTVDAIRAETFRRVDEALET